MAHPVAQPLLQFLESLLVLERQLQIVQASLETLPKCTTSLRITTCQHLLTLSKSSFGVSRICKCSYAWPDKTLLCRFCSISSCIPSIGTGISSRYCLWMCIWCHVTLFRFRRYQLHWHQLSRDTHPILLMFWLPIPAVERRDGVKDWDSTPRSKMESAQWLKTLWSLLWNSWFICRHVIRSSQLTSNKYDENSWHICKCYWFFFSKKSQVLFCYWLKDVQSVERCRKILRICTSHFDWFHFTISLSTIS